MKVKKIIAIVLAVLMVALCFAACGKEEAPNTSDTSKTSSDLQYIKDKGKLVIGITDYEPMNYKDKDGKWIGFDTEFAEIVGQKLGVEIEFVVLGDWGQKYNEIKSKSIDCAWNGLTIDDTAKANSSVTKPYAKNAQVVVMANDKLSKYTTAESIKDLKIAVEEGSAGQKAAQQNEYKNVIAVQDQAKALFEVKSGAADACIVDLTMAQAVTGEGKSYANFGFELSLTEEYFGIACRKGSDLCPELEKFIDELKADGTFEKLAKKYNVVLA